MLSKSHKEDTSPVTALASPESPSSSSPPLGPPPCVALPPPFLSYAHGQQSLIPILHPHQQPQHVYYYPISPPSNNKTPRILPKVSHDIPYYHPYISPSITLTTADEREKARKISHSAIERRRRERINDKIAQLKQLIPSCVDKDLHKMSVLQNAIDYIAYLKSKVNNQHLLKGDITVKTSKSMLPKEIEPFTTQFSIKPMDMSLHHILCDK